MRRPSSLRSRDPRETLAHARRVMGRRGVTRVTDITPLDRLGLPVFAGVRPRAQLVGVHAGKGLEPVDAAVGAAMEAIEMAVAEPDATPWQVQWSSLREWGRDMARWARPVDLAPVLGWAGDVDAPMACVACEVLGTASDHVLLPADLVFLPCTQAHASPFHWSGTGLASGNDVDEATLHALLEVLERDALAMDAPVHRSAWVEPGSLPRWLRLRAARWARAGVELAVRQLWSPTGLPCYEAWLHEPASESVDLAGGSGLHPDAELALTRAVCEAAQSRLTSIHGGREDVSLAFAKYRQRPRWKPSPAERALQARLFRREPAVRWEPRPALGAGATGLDQVLHDVCTRLAAAGLGPVFRYRFDAPDLDGLQVVKVVVAGCEEQEAEPVRMGPRLLERVLGTA